MVLRRTASSIAAALASVAWLAACYDFSFEPPPADAGVDDGAPAACTAGRLICGGERIAGRADTLYRCNPDGTTALVARCANGCVARSPEEEDACQPPTPCVVGGVYCGGDKINGEPDVLYRCTGGATSLVERCGKGCVVGAPGTDDACKR